MTIDWGITIAGCGLIIAVITIGRNIRNDFRQGIETASANNATLVGEVGHVKEAVHELTQTVKDGAQQVNGHGADIADLKSTSTQHEKRLDKIEDKLEARRGEG